MSKVAPGAGQGSWTPTLAVTPTMDQDPTLYCLCGKSYDPNIFMIQCDSCKDWFHGSCCNFPEYLAVEIDKYHCPRCVPLYGPSIYKPFRNWHRHDFWDENAVDKPVQTGTQMFIKELRARHFSSEGEIVLHMRGQQLTESLLQAQGFDNPIVVDGKDGLDMSIPPDMFSVYDVESYIGGDFEMDVIDSVRQTDLRMKLRDFIAYYNNLNRSRVFNVVSLEFSDTSLSHLVEAPLLARRLDWINTIWPRDFPISPPRVQKYCLMSVKDSYTDFHIDFGGTSVWYHVLRGEKIFYLIQPTPANLTLYQQWMTSTNQSETFFGDQVDQCYKCVLRQGQTMFIPTGWIHAVLTPVDSLVFGGNFLHSLNVPMQLQVYDIEKKIKTAEKFRYPFFEMINWFAARKLLQEITKLNAEEGRCPNRLLLALKALISTLKQWNTDKDYNTTTRDQIPYSINPSKLLKDISREIRHAERYINSLNPPKPERESKRKRRKPVNKDFVDYSSTSIDFSSASSRQTEPKQPPLKLTLPKTVPFEYTSTEGVMDWPDFAPTGGATSIHRGGAVLRFRLGNKNTVRDDGHIGMPESVYDFHDGSDREDDYHKLSIDESPRKKKQSGEGSLKVRLPVNWCKAKKNKKDPNAAKNGIESLLKASVLTTKYVDSGRTSPSTEEAIAGMLSISQTPSPVEETLNDVHQDEDYIYPSLDNSDDEDYHIFKPRGRSKVDEAWNPKARVGPLLPKMNRPAREGTKKQAIEKVLEAAAAKRASMSVEKTPKRQYRKKKVKAKEPEAVPMTSAGTSGQSNAPKLSSTTVTSTSTGTPKMRKGMKTVKQRLGKILKIHRMMH